MELTSLDLSIQMEDLQQLEGGHVQKAYQREKELSLEIYIPGDGKKRLIIGPNYTFISKYKRDNPTRPPGFCMELRKHLGKITKIRQVGFDRILEIETGDTKLICEIYGRGNYVLTKEDKIIGALREEIWQDREITVGEKYEYPDPTQDPREMDDYVGNLDEGDVVRKIASNLSLGGTYAEEIISRTGIDKEKNTEDLTEEEKERLNTEINTLIEDERSAVLYKDEHDFPVRASPFHLETYSDKKSEEFEQFSEALDEYFYRKERKKKEKKKREAYQEKRQGLEAQKNQQEHKIEGLKKSAEQKREDAEAIYENYQLLNRIKNTIEDAVEEHGWDETRETIQDADNEEAERINSLNEQNNFISVDVGNQNLKIYLNQDLEATASQFYDKAKNSEEKIESAKKALEKTEEQLEDLGEEDIQIEDVMEDKTQKRSKEWFEKYRWFYSSDNHLVIIGRDAQTNEMAVKKHMEPNDLYLHADFDGAPSVVIKDGQDAPEATREEAAQAGLTFTKNWKAGITAGDVYYVDPDQVTKEPESGEYLTKGAFVIRGDREYMHNVKVNCAVGAYQIEDTWVPMAGPESAIKQNCEEHIVIQPGHKKKSEIAKKINKHFEDYNLDLDYIIRSLPPGKSEIKNS